MMPRNRCVFLAGRQRPRGVGEEQGAFESTESQRSGEVCCAQSPP